MTARSVVTLGGGHGLYAMLSALRTLARRADVDITAVVTVADDGGSSGRLRRDNPGILPPGDLRMALAALADDGPDGALWATTFQHRFSGEGALAGHPVGNLVLAGLGEVLGDPIAALDAAGRMLGCRGRVLPMSCQPLTIVGEVAGLDDHPDTVRRIRGQVAVAATPGQVRSVALEPADATGCDEAVRAISGADLVILGPGSWFTSVLPHLLVPGLREALTDTAAHRLLVLNLVPQPGETEGFSPEQHLDVISAHAPAFRADTVLADPQTVPNRGRLTAAVRHWNGELWMRSVAAGGRPEQHDPDALADVLDELLTALPARASAASPAPTERSPGP